MTKKAKALLRLIGQTEDASTKLTKLNAKAAQELKDLDLATLIPISTGGAWIALTDKGIEQVEEQP